MSRFVEVSRRATALSLLRCTSPFSLSTTFLSNHHPSSNLAFCIGDAKPSQNCIIGSQFRVYSSHSHSHSHYMNQLYPRSNTSFQLSSGNALQANVVRLTEEVFLVDSGIGTPRTCLEDELVNVPKTKIRFENRVGFLDLVNGDSPIQKHILERFFIDLVAGDSTAKLRAAGRFSDLAADSADVDQVAAGDPLLVLPRRFRHKRVDMELTKHWRNNSPVKGFVVGKNRSGYAVAIAGYIAFHPHRQSMSNRRLRKDLFRIESLNSKTGNLVVL